MIKVVAPNIVAPNMACKVIDWAIQAFGGAGVSDDYPLGRMYANARTLRRAGGDAAVKPAR